jgi:predicted TIM-barrel fold metal-dependent hydrolase
MTSELGYRPVDCDNHYYEAVDAFTRHLDPIHGKRCVEWASFGKRKYPVIGGRVWHGVANPTFDPVSPAGAMHDYFRGNPDGKQPWEFLTEREPIPSEYRDRNARLVAMDRQGLDAVWLFPTLGMLFEEPLKHDPGAVTLTFSAFNRWLHEDWGFAHENRIFAAPYLSLADVDWACDELEWAIDEGARVIVMRPAVPVTATGPVNPFDERFDRFWSTVAAAGVICVIHAGDSGQSSNGWADDAFSGQFSGGWKPSIKSFAIERAAADFVITSVFHRMFDRFPDLRMASVENGSSYLRDAMKKLDSTHRQMPGYFDEHPVDSLRRGWWINPFWEDDVAEVIDLMGADRVIFGSDWPHIEGMPQPLDYVSELDLFDDDTTRRVLRENTAELLWPQGTGGTR